MKEYADKSFKFDENGRKVLQMGRKHCEKKRNCSSRAICPFLFPIVFSKDLYCIHVKTRACLEWVKSRNKSIYMYDPCSVKREFYVSQKKKKKKYQHAQSVWANLGQTFSYCGEISACQ